MMGQAMRFILVFIMILLFSGLSLAEELKIGLIPEQNVFKQFKRYEPVGKYLEKKTGMKIRFSVLPRYGNIIDRFNTEKMAGAFWGSFTGAIAIKKLGIEPLARPVNLDGSSTYRGYIFVHKYSVIDSVERMRNSVIAFVDKATTAGYVFPVAYLKENGVKDINSFFKEYYFTGSHDTAIYAVLNKEANVGCAKNTIFDSLARTDPRVKDDLVVLAKSPEVPSNALGLRRDLPPAIKKELKRALVEMDKDPEGVEILKEFGAIKFIETVERDYDPVFDIAQRAGIDLRNYRYANE
ncbi:MAG: phosphate/phosphite/phosphonate ABC transporter substrate-binding protein [Nitrospirae bacterium]|nr:phosphate/phosphite/phosphonate ABC transporter substrate-binding protein [Nitrospirota bacterium]